MHLHPSQVLRGLFLVVEAVCRVRQLRVGSLARWFNQPPVRVVFGSCESSHALVLPAAQPRVVLGSCESPHALVLPLHNFSRVLGKAVASLSLARWFNQPPFRGVFGSCESTRALVWSAARPRVVLGSCESLTRRPFRCTP